MLLGALPSIGVAADLVVAHIAPYSGPDAALGRAYGEGARLYFDRVNATGGVAGARIVFETHDDGGRAADTAKVAATAGSRNPIIVIGAVGIESVASLAPVLERLQIPLLGPVVGTADAKAIESRYVFYVDPEPVADVDALFGKAGALGLRKIAVCAPRDTLRAYTPGSPISTQHRGPALLATGRCDGDPTEIVAAARSIAATRPQAVIIAGSTRDAVTFVKALRAERGNALVLTASTIDTAALIGALPSSARSWIIAGSSVPGARANSDTPIDSVALEFLAMRKSAGSRIEISHASLAGFSAARIAVEAMRRAGADPSGVDLRNALSDMQRYDAGRLALRLQRDAVGNPGERRLISVSTR